MRRSSPGPALSGARMATALSAPVVARTAHFSVQHQGTRSDAVVPELSTENAPTTANSVDNTSLEGLSGVGFVIPKRNARRAVTRNLIRRLMRAALQAQALPPGVWVVRLRAPFDPRQFPSAASDALREAVCSELRQLFRRWAAA